MNLFVAWYCHDKMPIFSNSPMIAAVAFHISNYILKSGMINNLSMLICDKRIPLRYTGHCFDWKIVFVGKHSRQGVTKMHQSADLPSINPIKHLWDVLGLAISRTNKFCRVGWFGTASTGWKWWDPCRMPVMPCGQHAFGTYLQDSEVLTWVSNYIP